MPNLTSRELREFYYTSPMREGVLCWYPFDKAASALDMTNGALTDLLKKRCGRVVTAEGPYNGTETFDYIVVTDPADTSPAAYARYYSLLNEKGRLLAAFENPFGLQYFAGKRNPRTDMPFDFCGESRAEVSARLKQAGFAGQKWYYPFTNHYFTREVYTDACPPNMFLNMRKHIFTEDDITKAFDERPLWLEVIRGGAFAFLCCAYLVEARVCVKDAPCDVDYAAVTAYREPDKAFVTTLHSGGAAKKRALYTEGAARLGKMAETHAALAGYGVNVLPVRFDGECITMRRLDLPTLWDYWAEKLAAGELDDGELFRHFDRIRDAVKKAAKDGGCYWELVPANCFYDKAGDELIFFDQEYYWEDADSDIALIRALHAFIYADVFLKDPNTAGRLAALKARYGLTDKWERLAHTANAGTNGYVFNYAHTEPLERAAQAVEEHMQRKGRINE